MSATTFSYAQAARGRTMSQPNPQETSSPAPSTTGSQGKDDTSTGATSATAPSVASTNPETREAEQAAQIQTEGESVKPDSAASSVAGAPSSTVSVTEQPSKAAEEGSAKAAEVRTRTQTRSEDKTSRSGSRTSRLNDGAEGRKGRKGKKSRSSEKDAQSDQNQDEDAEKVKEPPKPVILTEAPPPAVNPWAKRIEAQKAAVQAKVGSDGAAADSAPKQNSSQEATSPRTAISNGVDGEKVAQKNAAEPPRFADQAPRRGAPRGSRAGDKDEKKTAALPPAADPTSWPDPKSAAKLEQPARKSHEKTESTDKDSHDEAGPTRKKTWEKLEIVHTVVFETQLPPPRTSKPRTGAARGGRDAGSMRGNQAAAGPQPAAAPASDKTPSPGGSTGPKNTTTRPRESSIASRGASHPQPPHPSKRPSMDAVSRDQRKPSVPASTTEQGRDTSLDASSSSKRASATKDIRMENGTLGAESNQAASRTQERSNFQPRGDFAKDAAHSQQYPARDGRPERGRGGGYRGRGGHNSSPLPTSSYGLNGHYAPVGFQSRQGPNAHSPPAFSSQFPTSFGHPSRGRGNKWSGAGQSAGRNAGATGYPPKITPVNDYGVSQYAPLMYSPVFDTSIPMLKSQVEYYLSVENLCKDYYLRQHMDGQGFVHLATIAGFKRIKTVTEDVELVRLACSISDHIEFGVGEDGIERLRPREKWQPFVLPVSERAEPYRNDGPANWTPYAKPETQYVAPFPGPIAPQQYPPAPAGFPAFAEEQMYPPPFANGAVYDPSANGVAMNGIHHGHETRLSAGVPEYAPPQSAVTLESMTSFPDSQVENLMVVLSYDEKGDAGSSDAAGMAGYVSHAGQNGVASSPETESVNTEPAADSASPNLLGRSAPSEREVVWVDGQTSASTTEQRLRRPYSEIRQAALEQRRKAKGGETPREMQKLYRFWSQMLLHDFNAKVYLEFRHFALDDASREAPSKYGLKYLLEFYDRLLLKTNTRKPWPQDRAVPEIFTAHLNEAVELNNKLGGKDVVAI